MTHTVLHIDTSARHQGSVTRDLTAKIVEKHSPNHVIARDLADTPLPQLTEDWVNANFTPQDSRTDAQKDTLALSDKLVNELKAADTIVIGLPMYNFSVPAALKAWIDLVARAGVTFRYTENGPIGLLEGKKAVIALASGGVPEGAPVDFATPYLRHVLSFLGITDVTVIAADQMGTDAGASIAKANEAVDAIQIAA